MIVGEDRYGVWILIVDLKDFETVATGIGTGKKDVSIFDPFPIGDFRQRAYHFFRGKTAFLEIPGNNPEIGEANIRRISGVRF
jgi:hypothetical protein